MMPVTAAMVYKSEYDRGGETFKFGNIELHQVCLFICLLVCLFGCLIVCLVVWSFVCLLTLALVLAATKLIWA